MIINDSYPYITIIASLANGLLTVTSVANGTLSAGLMVGGVNVPANTFLGTQISGLPGGPGVYPVTSYGLGVSGFPTPSAAAASAVTLASQPMLVAPWSLNIQQTIISQYANSPILLALVNNMNQYIDPSVNLFNFYSQIWNVLSASGYGLDVWGRIVGVLRNINMPLSALGGSQSVFYFSESGVGTPFAPGGSSPFYNGGSSSTVYRLSDSSYRMLILVKAFANITTLSAKAYNQMVQNLFGPTSCYISDMGNMSMQLNFQNLSQFNYYLLLNSHVLPRPAGVKIYFFNGYLPGQMFMFAESGWGTPFANGVAYQPTISLANGGPVIIIV